jgi:hypothetical protein
VHPCQAFLTGEGFRLRVRTRADTNFRSRLVVQFAAFFQENQLIIKDAREGACLSTTFQV